MDQEKWITEILNSTNGMQQTAPDDALFGKIQNRIYHEQQFSNSQIMAIAASFAILIALNIALFRSQTQYSQSHVTAIAQSVSKSYQLY